VSSGSWLRFSPTYLAKSSLHDFLVVPGTDTNDTKIETTAETVETVAEDPNALEARINTSYIITNCPHHHDLRKERF
jgi:hypothetical protein